MKKNKTKSDRHNGSSIRASEETIKRLNLFKRHVGVPHLDELLWQMTQHPTMLSYLVDRNQDTSFLPSETVLKQLRQRDIELDKNKFLVKTNE